MKNDLALPAQVEKQLTGLSRHVRLLRAWRGVCLLVFALAVCAGLVFVLDLILDLREEVLAPLLAGSVLVLGLVTIFCLVLPMMRRFDYAGLAAKVEQQHPRLAERLTSSVGLTGTQEPHGARVFLTSLLDETNERTQRLVFRHALSSRGTLLLTFLAIGMVLLLAVPAIAWPKRSADFGRRFLLSWFAPPALKLEVTPGNRCAALGRPLTISAGVSRRDERIAWPTSAKLLLTDLTGRQKSKAMHGQKENAFAFRIGQIDGSFSYRIQAGSATSDEYRITAVRPVELAANSPNITVTPPQYVNPNIEPPKKFPSTVSYIAAWQYSSVQIQFRFTRPAVEGTVHVSPYREGAKRTDFLVTAPIRFSEDRRSGSLVLPMLPCGQYRLTGHLEAEHGIATKAVLPDLFVRADAPPFFAGQPTIFGLGQLDVASPGNALSDLARVAPNDSLHIRIKAGDEVGLDEVGVEYRINGGSKKSIRLKDAGGSRLVDVDDHFELRALVKDGDKLYLRLRISDIRRLNKGAFRDARDKPVPATILDPQVIYYPAEQAGKPRWLAAVVDKDAKPLEDREIISQRDEVEKRIADLKEKVIQAREKGLKLEQPSRYQPVLKALQIHRLQELMKFNEKIGDDFNKLADKTSKIPELQEINDRAGKIAGNEIDKAGKALRQVETHKDEPKTRQREFDEADTQWARALAQLEQLHKFNVKRAQERLDATKLKQLAQREKDLSEQTAKLEKQQPLDNAEQKAEMARLKFEQDQVAQQLKDLTQNNPMVQQALQKAKAKEAGELSKKAFELAQLQKKLADEANKTLQKQLESLLDEIAKKQQKIADQALELKQQTSKDLQARRIVPFQPKPAQEAVQSIKTQFLMLALQQQDQSAQEMERVAKQLAKAVGFTGSPKQVARQLAARQKAIVEKLVKSSSRLAYLSNRELKGLLQEIYEEQLSIYRDANQLVKTLPQDPVKRAHKNFSDVAIQALRSLHFFNALKAHSTMIDAGRKLDALVQAVPDLPVTPKNKTAMQAKEALVQKNVKQLGDLSQAQRRLRRQLQDLLGLESLPPLKDKKGSLTKLAKKQEQLEKKADELMKGLMKLSQNKSGPKKAQKSANQASMAGKKAKEAMKQVQAKGKQGDAAGTKRAADEAAKKLTKSAQFAKVTAKQLQFQQPRPKQNPQQMEAGKQANKSLQKGSEQAKNAQKMLGKGKLGQAKKAMKNAAQALRNAANQMAKQMKKGSPQGAKPSKGPRQGRPGAAVDLKNLAKAQLGGKRWGELSGELKTRVLMDMRARYGAEYARVIQRYFERLADTKSMK